MNYADLLFLLRNTVLRVRRIFFATFAGSIITGPPIISLDSHAYGGIRQLTCRGQALLAVLPRVEGMDLLLGALGMRIVGMKVRPLCLCATDTVRILI